MSISAPNKRDLNQNDPNCLIWKIGDEIKVSDKLRINKIKEFFGEKPFTNEQLYKFYLEEEPDLKESTFR